MTTTKISRLRSLSDTLITEKFHEAESFVHLLKLLGSRDGDGNRRCLKARLIKLGLDPETLLQKGRDFAISKLKLSSQLGDDLIFREESQVNRAHVKKRILKGSLLEYRCADCGIDPEWNGKKLVLVLDHINGVHNDHRLENLRFLCPNCNSQTDTFTGRNVRKRDGTLRAGPKCTTDTCGCGAVKNTASERCRVCAAKACARYKIEWPALEYLAERVKTTPMSALSKELGVSDRALAIYLSKRGVDTPKRGFRTPNPEKYNSQIAG
jgi:hypothetical protein